MSIGAPLAVTGAAIAASGAALIAGRESLFGAHLAMGAVRIARGGSHRGRDSEHRGRAGIYRRRRPAGWHWVHGARAAPHRPGAARIADRRALPGPAGIAGGAAFIALGVAGIGHGVTLAGTATYTAAGAGILARWAVFIGPRTIVTQVRQAIDWATKTPSAI